MMPYVAIAIGVISVSLSAIFVKMSSAESAVIAFYRIAAQRSETKGFTM